MTRLPTKSPTQVAKDFSGQQWVPNRDTSQGETLGSRLRAGRLRYGWLGPLRCYVRLSDTDDDRFLVECCPPDQLPTRLGKDEGPFRIWYASNTVEDRAELRETAPMLAEVIRRVLSGGGKVTRLRKPVRFYMDDDGRFTGWAS